MTIQEAIDVLNTRGEHGNLTGYAAWQTEALDMAVRSLELIKKIEEMGRKQAENMGISDECLRNHTLFFNYGMIEDLIKGVPDD